MDQQFIELFDTQVRVDDRYRPAWLEIVDDLFLPIEDVGQAQQQNCPVQEVKTGLGAADEARSTTTVAQSSNSPAKDRKEDEAGKLTVVTAVSHILFRDGASVGMTDDVFYEDIIADTPTIRLQTNIPDF